MGFGVARSSLGRSGVRVVGGVDVNPVRFGASGGGEVEGFSDGGECNEGVGGVGGASLCPVGRAGVSEFDLGGGVVLPGDDEIADSGKAPVGDIDVCFGNLARRGEASSMDPPASPPSPLSR